MAPATSHLPGAVSGGKLVGHASRVLSVATPDAGQPFRKGKADKDFLERTRLVFEVCELLALDLDVVLYGDDYLFPLAPPAIDDFIRLADHVFDRKDAQARKIARLVARAFDGHEAGMEYLCLRSKTFRTNRTESLKL